MVLNFIILFYVFLVFILSSIQDFKKRETYNFFHYFSILFIFLISLFQTLLFKTNHLSSFLIGTLFGFVISYIFYSVNFWGGGDAKFFIFFGGAFSYIQNFFPNIFQFNFQFNFFHIFNFKIFYLIFLILNFCIFFILIFNFIKEGKKQEINFYLSILSIMTFNIFYIFEFDILPLFFFILILVMIDKNLFFHFYILKMSKPNEVRSYDVLAKPIKISKKIINENKPIFENDLLLLKKYKKKIPLRKSFNLEVFFFIQILFVLFNKIIIFKNFTLFLEMMIFFIMSILFSVFWILIITGKYFFENKKKTKKLKNFFNKNFLIWFILFVLIFLTLQKINKEISLLFLVGFLISFLLFKMRKVNNFLCENIFLKNQKLKEIVPGDIPLSDILYKNKIIFLRIDIKNGFTEEQIKYLNKRIKNKNFKIKVNWGIPFIPMMFFSFLFMFILFLVMG